MRRMFSLAIALLFVNSAFAQDSLKYKLAEIYVTASNIPMMLSEVSRTVRTIKLNQIEDLPNESLSDVLSSVSGLDVRNRGTDDIQSDIAMRGGTFEQTLILVDDIPVNDPQTGHHTMNLPIELENIDRIEILKGQGSKSFGPNAFSGAVNFITKSSGSDNVKLSLTGGQYGYYKALLSGEFNSGSLYNNLSYSKTVSDGYTPNTNFEKHLFSYSHSININNFVVKNRFAFNDKRFGANSFYSIRFPKQSEHTKTLLGSSSILTKVYGANVNISAYYRRNSDEFLLDYTNPGFYKNTHLTQTFGLKSKINFETILGKTAIGGEYRSVNIESNNLGDHTGESGGIFLEHLVKILDRINISIGGFVYNYSGIGWKFWPGGEIGLSFSQKLQVYASLGKAFRIPTFTELYYEDPVTKGNPNLYSEETINAELGVKYHSPLIKGQLAVFNNNGKNIIDWVRLKSDEKWNAENIANLNTSGLEINLSINTERIAPFINEIDVRYSYLHSDKKAEGYTSKYALEYLRNQLVITVKHNFIFNSQMSWVKSFSDRNNMDDLWLTDVKASKKFEPFTWTITVKNLFDRKYSDFLGVQLPGRWVRTGVSLELK